MKAVALALVVTGCFSKPHFTPGDGGGGDDAPIDAPGIPSPAVNFTMTGNGATVSGSFFTLHFSSVAGFHFPDQLLIDGVNHLGFDSGATCYAENEAGMGLFPANTIRSRSAALVAASNLTAPQLRGPAAVKVWVFWVTTLMGMDTAVPPMPLTRQPTGISTFTIFPDGRIVRSDSMSDTQTMAIDLDTIDCLGQTNSPYYPTSFWTLDNPVPATPPLLFDAAGLQTPFPAGGNALMGQQSACLDYGTQRVAFAWPTSMNTRLRAPTANLFAFVQDFATAHNVQSVADFMYTGHSAIFLGHGPQNCVDSGLLARAQGFATTPMLQVNAAFVSLGDEGIYGTEAMPVDATSPVVLRGTIPSTFAVWLRFPADTPSITVTKADTAPPYYTAEQVIGRPREWVIWFRDPLTSTQMITVTAP